MTGRRWCALGSVVLLLGALPGCTCQDEDGARAKSLCRGVDPHDAGLIASYPTTVQAVHARRYGPRSDASKAPFVGLPDGFAAWCWFERPEQGQRFVVAALPTGEHVGIVVGDAEALEPNADGPVVP